MDRKNIKSILQDALEDQIPTSQINLLPVIQSHVIAGKKSLLLQEENINKIPTRQFAFFVLIVIAVLALITPQGRAWAQEVVQFFRKINSDTIQLSDEQSRSMNEFLEQMNKPYDLPLMPVFIPPVPPVAPDMAKISGCETPQKSESYHCQVALAESKLGFDLKELPEKPKGWEFQSLWFNSDSRTATISYELDIQRFGGGISSSNFVLIQGMGNPSKSVWFGGNSGDVVPADKVESVSVGAYQGEYVKGDFNGFSSKPGDNIQAWSYDDHRQRLAWSEGSHWYLIDFSPNLNIANTMNKDDLIRLAQSLVTSPAIITEPLDPAHLTSVSDAEKISGLDLKAPTLLPMNIDFSYAHYFQDKKEVHLVYGFNEELDIQEWEGKPVEFKKPLGKYEFTCEIVSMNGNEAFYCFFDGPNHPNPRAFLWWRKDNLNYQMSYVTYTGGKINREQMLLIAESMRNIDDYQKNGKKSYEQIVLYEQALGIDAKKFPQTSTEWTFVNFYGEPFTQCIGLLYTSTTKQGTLFINQCKTNKASDLTAFPSRSIERVKVGSNRGQYITGGFVIADNGKQVWDSTLPVKLLYWQDDGLWLQMFVSGESAVQHTKEDLISLAESLR